MAAKKRKLTKKQREQRRRISIATVVIFFIFGFGYLIGKNGIDQTKWEQTVKSWEARFDALWNKEKAAPQVAASPATIHFLDVGQGSATLLQSDDGTTILIDSGRHDDKQKKILQYLDRYVGTGGKIDLLVFTHNHADHLGYGDQILSYYQVKEVWMNGLDATSKVYERVLDAIESSNTLYAEPKAGDKKQVGPFQLDVLSPFEGLGDDQNENSISTRIGIDQLHVMITGDAGSMVEKKILETTRDVHSDILVLGHHGSKYSSSTEWLEAVKPDFAVYSAGEDNVYGHPSEETVERVTHESLPLYGTDKDGTISVFVTESGEYRIETEKGGEVNEDGSGRN